MLGVNRRYHSSTEDYVRHGQCSNSKKGDSAHPRKRAKSTPRVTLCRYLDGFDPQLYDSSMQAAIRMPTVLCIDDNAEALKIRIRMLETEGYSVLTANNGAVGLKLLAENSVDVVVLDYMMPEMDGLAVAMAIREHHGQVPILLLTGYPKVPKELLEIVNGCVRKGQAAGVLLGELERLGVRATKAPRQ